MTSQNQVDMVVVVEPLELFSSKFKAAFYLHFLVIVFGVAPNHVLQNGFPLRKPFCLRNCGFKSYAAVLFIKSKGMQENISWYTGMSQNNILFRRL